MAKQNCRCYSNSNNRLAWVTPAPHRPAQRVFQFLILIFHSLHSLSFPPSLSLSLTLHIFRYESELNLNLIELELRCRILLRPEKRDRAALRSLAAEALTGDGVVRNERSLRLRQRHPQLSEQGTGEAPRRQGTWQHPKALQNREGQGFSSSFFLFQETCV